MKFVSLLFALVLVSGASAQDVTQHTSPDGHRFNFLHMPDTDRVAVAVAWRGGSGNLPEGKESVGKIAIDLMLNGGADGRTPNDIRSSFEAMDAGSHLYTAPYAIHGFVVAPLKDLATTSGIANSVLARPTFDERWFKRVLRRFRNNAVERTKFNNGQAWNAIRTLTMGGHPLEPVWSLQPASQFDNITVEDIRQWHLDSFSSNDLVISAAGNGTAEEIARGLDVTLKGLPGEHKRRDYEPLTLSFSGKTILIHRPKEEKSYMAIVGPLPSAAHEDNLAIQLGAGVLGQSEQSRLFKAVRGDVRSTYGFGARIHAFTRTQSMLALTGEVETSKLAETLATVETTYYAFKSDGIGFVEFPFAKRIMLKLLRTNYEKPATLAFVMTEAVLQGEALEAAVNRETQASQLGRSDVNAVISEHFPDFDQMLKIIVSPDENAVEADCIISDFTEAASCL